MHMFATLLVGLLAAVALVSATNPSAPVLIWGSDKQYNQATAIHEYSGEELVDFVSVPENVDKVTVVLLENTLSTSDLSQYGKSFENLKQVTGLVYLANVAEPVQALTELAGSNVQYLSIEDDVLAAVESAKSGSYLFVELGAAAQDESREQMFARHDALIHGLNVQLKSVDKQLVFVLSGSPSSDSVAKSRSVRQAPASIESGKLPAATTEKSASIQKPPTSSDNKQTAPEVVESNETFFNRSRVLIYFKSLTFDGTPIQINDITITETSATVLAIELIAAQPSDNIAFNITTENGYWGVEAFSFRGDILTAVEYQIATMDGFSFHCSPSLHLLSIQGVTSALHLSGLQLEPIFGTIDATARRSAFSEPWDCVGFVSTGIVSGLFVVFMLLLILAVGISWIMDIKTMDRFDDPKGKTIIVNQGD